MTKTMHGYQWLTVEEDGAGRAVDSYLTGMDLPSEHGVVPMGATFHQDLVETGWKPIWVRHGKSVWAPVGELEQALSDYWLLIETKRMSKERK